MASYFTCPSCGHYLANVILPYQNDMNKLAEKLDLHIDDISREKDDKKILKAKSDILDKYTERKRYCCRQRLMNMIDIVNLIN